MTRPAYMTRECHFAWLLRDDVRALLPGDPVAAMADFAMWWLINRKKEYPRSEAPSPDLVALAGEIVRPGGGLGGEPPLTRLMETVWRLRADLAEAIPPDRPGAVSRLVAWFYAVGVAELDLFDSLAPSAAVYLGQPQPFPDGGLHLPRLLVFVGQIRPDVARFAEGAPGRLRLVEWYLRGGLFELGHEPYFEPRALAALTGRSGGVDMAALARAGGLDLRGAIRLPAPSAPAAPAMAGPRAGAMGVNLVGYAKGELGTGEDTRMAARSLAAVGAPFAVVNIPTGPNTRQADASLDGHLSDEAPYPINIFCLTGFDTAGALLRLGPGLFRDRLNIGYWPWELSEWPEAWRGAYDLVDEIWTSTRFAQAALARDCPVPVRYMPFAVTLDGLRSLPRAAFGLPEGRFLFLYAFDFNSYLARKNPFAALEAFRRAFPRGDEPAGLVVKTMYARDGDPRWRAFSEACAADGRVVLLTETLTRGDVLGLMACCDAYVSPHRSEGFGRTLAEAMLLEKPVVATGYSGNADFLTPETGCPLDFRLVPVAEGEYPFSAGMYWAEPDLDQAAAWMRRLAADPGLCARFGRAGRALIATRHDPRAVGRGYLERLSELAGGRSRSG